MFEKPEELYLHLSVLTEKEKKDMLEKINSYDIVNSFAKKECEIDFSKDKHLETMALYQYFLRMLLILENQQTQTPQTLAPAKQTISTTRRPQTVTPIQQKVEIRPLTRKQIQEPTLDPRHLKTMSENINNNYGKKCNEVEQNNRKGMFCLNTYPNDRDYVSNIIIECKKNNNCSKYDSDINKLSKGMATNGVLLTYPPGPNRDYWEYERTSKH